MSIDAREMKFYGIRDIDKLPQLQRLSAAQRHGMKVVANVLPFRANNYVVEELIDWDHVPDDPIFRLTFPQPHMLSESQFARMDVALKGDDKAHIKAVANEIRLELNPHPAGQKVLNVPSIGTEPVPGVQRKYRETALVFPARGQTCHAYCTFCFRWPQFVGMEGDLKFATDEARRFADFIRDEKTLTDVLVTGGDPMVMRTKMVKQYLESFLEPGFEHIQTVRIGTKSVSYWPYRYVTDPDADDLLRLFERLVKAGKHVAVMGHYNHWMECSTPVAQEAIRRIRSTGAVIRTQSPLIRNINDSSDTWVKMWNMQVKLGCVPYYMFVERDTGASHYFSVPLARAYGIFHDAIQRVSGLGRTARGPSMSATPGKVVVDGISEVNGEKVFVLSFMQGRNPDWVKRPFFAKFDPEATWLDDLEPAFGASRFFYEDELEEMAARAHHPEVVKLHLPTRDPSQPLH